jgi:hypothetical protein
MTLALIWIVLNFRFVTQFFSWRTDKKWMRYAHLCNWSYILADWGCFTHGYIRTVPYLIHGWENLWIGYG